MFEGAQQRPLFGLIGCVVALMAWTLADEWHTERSTTEGRKATAVRLLARDFRVGDDHQRELASQLQSRRELLMQRLAIPDSLETGRARVYYELREHCSAVGVTCNIQLSEAGKAAQVASNVAEPGSLEALGIRRVLAKVSGSVGNKDVTALLIALANDSKGHWRVRQVQLRGRGFELEVERHMVPNGVLGSAAKHD